MDWTKALIIMGFHVQYIIGLLWDGVILEMVSWGSESVIGSGKTTWAVEIEASKGTVNCEASPLTSSTVTYEVLPIEVGAANTLHEVIKPPRDSPSRES